MSNEQSSKGPTNVEKLRGLPWGVAWSVTNSVFAQYTFFGSVFVLFLNQLGLEKGQIGSLLSLLPFLGIVAVFIASPLAAFGHKRSFLVSMAARTMMAALLLLTPLLLGLGEGVILAYIVILVALFGLFRATGFTAFYPWLQEQVPDTVRGKYTATKNTLSNLVAFIAMVVAGYILGPDPTLRPFLILIAIGVVFGVVSVWTATHIPGGAPVKDSATGHSSFRETGVAARDPNFRRFLIGFGLVTLATGPLVSFVPLFMKEQVGLSSDRVVWLETGVLLGGLASSYLWGWLSDRYGSKPVMISGVYLLPLLPIAWLLMPRGTALSLYFALAIAVAQGFVNTGWNIGSGRLLLVRVVPSEKRTAYLALYYAWVGISGALGQFLGGWLVDSMAGVDWQWWIVRIDPYSMLFAVGIIGPIIALFLFRQVLADSSVTTRQFAGMFLRGNPFLAIESLVRYHHARDERAAVALTERMGTTKSPLAIEELIEALHDPRFFVRFEAIVSIARNRPDPQLTTALVSTLQGNEPSLSTVAAWGLGRIGDEQALGALRKGLTAHYRSVQAHCARSLGSLDDQTVIPLLLNRLRNEEDLGLQMAFAAALGQLGASEATAPTLDLLRTAHSQEARTEFTLAIARLLGDEHRFVQLQRRALAEPGTAFSQEVTAIQGKLSKSPHSDANIEKRLEAVAGTMAQDDLSSGLNQLHDILLALPVPFQHGICGQVLSECTQQIAIHGSTRIEYLLLALQALDCALAD